MSDTCPWPRGMPCILCSRAQPGHREECMEHRILHLMQYVPRPRVKHTGEHVSLVGLPEWSFLKHCAVVNLKRRPNLCTGAPQWDLSFVGLPPGQYAAALEATHGCPNCAYTMHAVKPHEGPAKKIPDPERNERYGGTVYWSPVCRTDENKSCSKGNAASWGYVAVKAALLHDETVNPRTREMVMAKLGALTILEHAILDCGPKWRKAGVIVRIAHNEGLSLPEARALHARMTEGRG